MGRPTRTGTNTKTVGVRMTDAEIADLDQKRGGLSRSDWLRMLARQAPTSKRAKDVEKPPDRSTTVAAKVEARDPGEIAKVDAEDHIHEWRKSPGMGIVDNCVVKGCEVTRKHVLGTR